MALRENIEVVQGKTFSRVVRWEVAPIIYRPITGIVVGAPARLTVPAHGMVDGWRGAVTAVKGMTQINATKAPPKDSDYHAVSVVDADTVEFNDVNAAAFAAYVSGGYLQYNTPASLVGHSARMSVKAKVGGEELLRLDTTLVAPQPRIVLDDAAKTITLSISAADTAALGWTSGVYDLEVVSPAGIVTLLMYGKFTVVKEVTTT